MTVCLMVSVVQADESVPGQVEFETLGKRYTAELDKYWANVGEGKPAEEHERFVLEHWPGNTINPEFLRLESKYRGTVIIRGELLSLAVARLVKEAEQPR